MVMKIGLLIDTLTGGGAERITLNFAETFSALENDVHVFILINEIKHEIAADNYKLHILTDNGQLSKFKILNKLKLAILFRKIVREIESDGVKFDFFISSSADFDRITRGMSNVYIRYRNSMWEFIQGKVGNRTGFKAWERRWRHILKHRSIYNGRKIVAITDAMHEDLCDKVGIRPKTIKTIYNPFDFNKIRKKADEVVKEIPEEPYIIYVAKFENRKNHELLLNAYALANPNCKLVLLGDVYTESDKQTYTDMLRQIKILGIGEQVIIPGFQKNPYPWVKNAKLFVMSSNSEGLPTVLIEALILGTPVVSVDCPTGPREILEGELAGFLSPVNDANALALNINKALVSYPAITQNMIDKFDNWKVARQYLEYCER